MRNFFSFLTPLIKKNSFIFLRKELKEFIFFLNIYTKDKVFLFSDFFEGNKNSFVKSILIKRGKRNRFFLHAAAMGMLFVGVLISPFVSDSTLFGKGGNFSFAQGIGGEASISPDDVFNTQASEKPRDKIINYTVQKGDTLSSIAKKFDISTDTIKWENNLKGDSITVGDSLRILPVTGIAHKIARGDTVYSIAKKYGINAQGIVDYPFNDFANPQTFSLVEGGILIVPDGVEPKAAPTYVRRTLLATGPVSITNAGFTWPTHGTITQGFFWYHPGVDVGAPVGTPIVAASDGTVSQVYNSGWNSGYGIHVIIGGSNGYTTLYAHMQATNVSPGDHVIAGKTILGWIGMTGRTTGPHLHFEIRSSSGNRNPLSFL